MAGAYAALGHCWEGSAWLRDVVARAQTILEHHPHGDLAAWLEALRALPPTQCALDADRAAPRLGNAATDAQYLREVLLRLHPWRKGPLELGGVLIDTEWRSDWKWERIRPFLDLENQRVLDIGCGNGYFGWRMLAAGARLVVGVDPSPGMMSQAHLPGVQLVEGRAEAIPFPDASFDVESFRGALVRIVRCDEVDVVDLRRLRHADPAADSSSSRPSSPE